MKFLIPAFTTLLCAVVFAAFMMRRGPMTSTPALERADGVRSPVIVELFTSEGCSSCPPADVVLERLQQTQPVAGAEVIALGEHVDYWNYIGWSDPFSSAAFSARQETYARALGQQDRVYTPQIIVDGQTEFNGSAMNKALEAIAKAARSPKADVRIVIPETKIQKDNQEIRFNVSVKNVPPVDRGDVAEVILALTEDKLSSNVTRGENSGRKLAHTAVVREMRALGRVDPATKTFDSEKTMVIADGWKRDDLRVVVFVQERAQRRVLGAAVLNLAAPQATNR
ncbi:MAG TPA: DUF1223 domain-containing protein [Blastocatellia bacterium]|jgi:hypothetical protein